MNSYSMLACLLLVVSLVSAHEAPVVVVEQPFQGEHGPAPVVASEQHHQHHQHHQGAPVQAQPPHFVSEHPVGVAVDVNKNLYMPGSLVPVSVESQPASGVQNNKPGQVNPAYPTNNKEQQYGAPEPAGMPANYKPFGSWGLYVGGNPPDGYYSNFYKSIDGVQGVQGQQVSGGQQSSSPLSPYVYKHAGPVQVGQPEYAQPFVYSADELNSAYPMSHYPSSYMPGFVDQPEFYATKRVGSPAQQAREISKTSSSASSGTKGFQQQSQQQAKGQYAFSPVAYDQAPQQNQQQQYQYRYPQAAFGQVVPYSVPVGSQIVGSQPGADGAFSPYGVHAFTRYAVKPAVGQNYQHYYQQGAPVPAEHAVAYDQSSPVHKQQHQRPQYQPFGYYQPSSFAYQSYQMGVPSLQHQFTAHGVAQSNPVVPAPVAPLAAPVSKVESVESPVVPMASPVAPVETPEAPVVHHHAAPASPVQVGQAQASAASPLESPVSQQQEQVQQQQQQVDKSSVKQ